MLKVNANSCYNVQDVQQDLQSMMLNNINESFQSHCKLNPAVHSAGSSEEETE